MLVYTESHSGLKYLSFGRAIYVIFDPFRDDGTDTGASISILFSSFVIFFWHLSWNLL